MLFTLLLYFLCICYCYGDDSEDEYILSFESEVYVVGGSNKYIDTSKIKCERHNDSVAFMHGGFDFLQKMDKLVLEATLEKEVSGRHEMVISHDICDLCKEMGDADSDYYEYLQYIGLPTSCPFEPQFVEINNLIVDTKKLGIKDEHCGEYICTIVLYKKVSEDCKADLEELGAIKVVVAIQKKGQL